MSVPNHAEPNQERWCPSCKLRYRVGPPHMREWQFIELGRGTIVLLLAAAREFDETAEHLTPGECFSAVDFMDWIRPSLKRVDSPASLRGAG